MVDSSARCMRQRQSGARRCGVPVLQSGVGLVVDFLVVRL